MSNCLLLFVHARLRALSHMLIRPGFFHFFGRTFFNVINEKIGRLGLKYAEIKQIKDDNMADKYWYASISPDSYSAASSVWLKRCRTDVQGIGKHPKRSQSRKQGIWFVGPENLLRYRAAPLQENHRDSCHRIAVQRPAGPQQVHQSRPGTAQAARTQSGGSILVP